MQKERRLTYLFKHSHTNDWGLCFRPLAVSSHNFVYVSRTVQYHKSRTGSPKQYQISIAIVYLSVRFLIISKSNNIPGRFFSK